MRKRPPRPYASAASACSAGPRPTHEHTVLLVDDARDDRSMYAEFLRSNGLAVIEVGQTPDAERFSDDADVIVTGILVPGDFDGVELVCRLRADERTRLTPIIVLTACAFEADRRRALAAGCDLFLSKPCLPDRLLHEIQLILERRRTPPAMGEPEPLTQHARVRGRVR